MATKRKTSPANAINKVLLGELFERKLTKSEQRKLQIVEAAVEVFANSDWGGPIFAEVARACGISLPLVHHYFPTQLDLFDFAVKYVRAKFQASAVDFINLGKTPQEKIENYVESIFNWPKESLAHAKFWLLYYHRCASNKESLLQNTELVDIGHDRIKALIDLGVEARKFKCVSSFESAKVIQIIVTGAFITIMTEGLRIDIKNLKSAIKSACLKQIGA